MVTYPLSPGPTEGDSRPGVKKWDRSGFTLLEVIIAIVVLAFGLLAMAGTTAIQVRQINLADIATERSAALQSTLERLSAIPFDSVVSGADSIGLFEVQWRVTAPTNHWKSVDVITLGPGMGAGSGGFPMLVRSVPDTFTYRILRP